LNDCVSMEKSVKNLKEIVHASKLSYEKECGEKINRTEKTLMNHIFSLCDTITQSAGPNNNEYLQCKDLAVLLNYILTDNKTELENSYKKFPEIEKHCREIINSSSDNKLLRKVHIQVLSNILTIASVLLYNVKPNLEKSYSKEEEHAKEIKKDASDFYKRYKI
jgi:hypothetical protein